LVAGTSPGYDGRDSSKILDIPPAVFGYPGFMPSAPAIANIAAQIANPGRANMLIALLEGGEMTAGALAESAHLSPQTASGYLAAMTAQGLIRVERRGRSAWHRLASPEVGRMIEAMMAIAPARAGRPASEALRGARTCYDHLAGRLGVAIADALRAQGHIELGEDGGAVTPSGGRFLADFGIDLRPTGRRAFCRPCLDWSVRRPHLAGQVGASLAARCFELGWVRRMPGTRALALPLSGREGLRRRFGIETF
jgi:DNA-binding transcriptional ArsR family regulator